MVGDVILLAVAGGGGGGGGGVAVVVVCSSCCCWLVLKGSGKVGVEEESVRSVDGVVGRLGVDMVGVRALDGTVKVGLGAGKGEKRVGDDGGAAGVVGLGLMETSLLSASLMDVLSASLMDVSSGSLMDVSSGESTVMTFSALLSTI